MKWGLSMIELTDTRPTTTTFAFAIGAAMLTGNLQYPLQDMPYEVQQVRGTYSTFLEGLAVNSMDEEHFAQQVAAIYNSLAQRQERLGEEFEAAIFSDLESLYEA